ncbi:MAG: thiamine pyrophosphate-binding protein, partial [Acidobacteriota bacterium]|nr:thiamine pyrophosphate-binding protein [Acidobacteriota bacterium]
VVKWAAEPPSAEQIPFYLGRACSEANAGRKGPVHLTIPTDLFDARTDAPFLMPQPLHDPGAEPDDDSVTQALAMMRAARQPVVIAGSGIWWSHGEAELARFIEHTGFPLYTAALAKGCVPDDHPLCFGYPDPALNQAARKAFAEADLIVIAGKRVDYRLTLGGAKLLSPDAKCIQIDNHAPEIGLNRRVDLGICADAAKTLRKLTNRAGAAWPELPWISRLRAFRDDWQAEIARRAESEAGLLHPAAFYAEFRKHLPRETIISWDGGDFVQWGRVIMPATGPGRWLRLGPLGTIGAGLPHGIALQIANPESRVVVVTGDGSLGFYIAELDSAVRHKLPLVIIVGNDAGWGLERELQGAGNTVACELLPTRYDRVMQGFGGDGETIQHADEIGSALARAFASGMPYLINVRIRGARSPFTEWQLAGKRAQA